ncbi:MAG: hypothetical protein H7840_17050, partial [Alphaproteobacteria bacterium]
ATPDATLVELRAWAQSELGVSISIGALWGALDRLGLRLEQFPLKRKLRKARAALERPEANSRAFPLRRKTL